MTLDWVVLELSPQGEDEDPDVLQATLRRLLKTAVEIFIPASVSIVAESRVVHRLIDNYVFIRRSLPDHTFLRLENTKYVASILTINRSGVRQITCIKDADIEKMRRQIHVETEQGIEVGDEVKVESGPYKGINGRVIEEIPENDSVQVFIKLRSKQAIVTLPRSFLRFVSKDSSELPTFSPFGTKVTRIQEWVNQVRPLLRWSASAWNGVREGFDKYDRIAVWVDKGRRLFEESKDPMAGILSKYGQVQSMNQLIKKEPGFFELLGVGSGLARAVSARTTLEQRVLDVEWLEDVTQRLQAISESLSYVEKAVVECKPDMVENVIIDGHNLAYRVHFALGMMKTPMTDPEGNPTGLVYGFLKSLAALKKRYDNATFHVVWDGAPQRRVNLFAGYKADRREKRAAQAAAIQESGVEVRPDDQMNRLRKLLPMLGVVQAFNADEETDDVIACLVKGKLKGKRNVILSTDRDFLQLVTYTDLLLVPKVGNRPETLYDRDKVVEEYGVTPERMVQLRALLGDTSDNIPGVPRVPTKVLTALVNTHGTVDGILSSNLAGLTSSQFEKLRASEAQVRLNVQLMTLLSDLPFEEVPSQPDASAVAESLGGLNIQPESIVAPFFQKAQPGFFKS